jgi:hypothetical protein
LPAAWIGAIVPTSEHELQRTNAEVAMSLVRLLGFKTLTCGCVSGRYRETGSDREITYIEEKGASCATAGHRRNQPVSPDRVAHGFNSARAS